jgi:hypothetical protein
MIERVLACTTAKNCNWTREIVMRRLKAKIESNRTNANRARNQAAKAEGKEVKFGHPRKDRVVAHISTHQERLANLPKAPAANTTDHTQQQDQSADTASVEEGPENDHITAGTFTRHHRMPAFQAGREQQVPGS